VLQARCTGKRGPDERVVHNIEALLAASNFDMDHFEVFGHS
jgi:hypothetical protein